MDCSACGHSNREQAKFCEECGAPLKRSCAGCGIELRPQAKFCDSCGVPVSTGASPESPTPALPTAQTVPSPASSVGSSASGARKVVTVVFADLAGSTALQERVDAESARRLMESYYAELTQVVQSNGGSVVKLLGDGVMAAFGVPRVGEDDALRAVRAAAAMQEAFDRLVERQAGLLGNVGLRVAVNTGEVVVSDGNDDVVGDPVNVAARLQEEAGNGDVVVGEATRRLVADEVTLEPLGSVALKGRTETVGAYRLVSLERPAGAAATPFVGRDAELARLQSVFDSATGDSASRMAVLLGSPGLGKSRLIDEFGHRLGDAATRIDAHCDAAGGATFAPLADAFHRYLGIDADADPETVRASVEAALSGNDSERARIADGIAALVTGAPSSPEETFFVVRRMLASLAGERPVLLVIDDLQWGEPLLLDLIEHLIEWGEGVPLFVLVGARPELRDVRSSMANGGGLVREAITLSGLDAAAAMQHAADVIGASGLPAAVAAKVLASSEGNPLFVSELVRMLVHEGVLAQEGDDWVVGEGLEAFEMPPTIHALLAARIERLRPEERTILERAAVVGRHFSRGAVAELLPNGAADLDEKLEALRRSELIERDTGWFIGEPGLRFHHVLIRDAAYRRLLKETRAELHSRCAEWIERKAGESVDHDESIGRHYEQAYELLGELGPLTEAARDLGERAAARLADAGRRALTRDDVTLAANLLGRALECANPDHSDHATLVLDACEAQLAAGEVAAAAPMVEELGRISQGSERLTAWHTCFVGELTALNDPDALRETADAVAEAAKELASLGDTVGEAKAHFVHAQALARLGQVGAAESALDLALAAARSAGDRRRANAVLAGAPLAALWGPSPVTRASGRCLDVVRVLRITQGAPAVEAVALSCQGVLEALRGRTDAARRMIESSRALVEELGISSAVYAADVFAARLDILEEDFASAELRLRQAYDGLRSLGLGIDAARAAALLAKCALNAGRPEEAESLSHESERLAGDDLQAGIAWRVVRAQSLAGRGETEAAVAVGRTAVELAAQTDALLDHADARLALADALRASGHTQQADAEERKANQLWREKGASLLLEADGAAGATAAVSNSGSVAPGKAATVGSIGDESRNSIVSASMLRSRDVLTDAWATGDIDRIAAVMKPDGVYDDRRRMSRVKVTLGETLPGIRKLLELPNSRYDTELVATRGERVRLVRASWTGDAGQGAQVERTETLRVLCYDADGRYETVVTFDADDESSARAELERLWDEIAAREHPNEHHWWREFERAYRERDWEAFDQLDCDEMVAENHRLVGWGRLPGKGAWVEVLKALVDLAPDVRIHVDHVRLADRVLAWQGAWRGTQEGGAFDIPIVVVAECSSNGRVLRFDVWDGDGVDAAVARFEALAGGSVERTSRRFVPSTPATRVRDLHRFAYDEGVRSGDWSRMRGLFTADAVYEDRQSFARVTGDIETFLGSLKQRAEQGLRFGETRIVGAAGERLTLFHLTLAGGPADGRIEIDYLGLTETDPGGLVSKIGQFDVADSRTALDEMHARWVEIDPSVKPWVDFTSALDAAYDAHNVEALACLYADDLIVHDHRRTGFGRLERRDAFVAAIAAFWEIAGEARIESGRLWPAVDTNVAIFSGYRAGTVEDGGEYVSEHLSVVSLEDGLVNRVEMFEIDDLDGALACFEALRTSNAGNSGVPVNSAPRTDDTRGALVVPENTAARAGARWREAIEAGDTELAASFYAPSFNIDNRRRMFRMTSDRETELLHLDWFVDGGWKTHSELVATAGEYLSLSQSRLTRGDADAPDEIVYLTLGEVNEKGLFTRAMLFDPEDRKDAHAHLVDWRAETSDGNYPLGRAENLKAWNAHDAERLRDTLAENYYHHDRRRTGLGVLEGRDAFVQAAEELWKLSPDVSIEFAYELATAPHGVVQMVRWLGTDEHGGPFESVFIGIAIVADGVMTRGEAFEPEQVAEALARFEELAPDVLAIPENAATRTLARYLEAMNAGDLPVAAAFLDPKHVEDDRRKMVRTETDREGAIRNFEWWIDGGWQCTRTVLATAGDRIALHRYLLWVGEGADRSEVELLEIDEVNDSEHIVRVTRFDTDQQLEAGYVLLERLGSAVDGFTSRWGEFFRAFAKCDLEAIDSCLAEDFVFVDRQRAGLGRLEKGAYLESVRAIHDISREISLRITHTIDVDARGFVGVGIRSGTNNEGGEFETYFISVVHHRGDELTGIELFEPEDLDKALARYEELRPNPLRVPPNAASRAVEKVYEFLQAGDREGWVGMCDPSIVVDDRRSLVRTQLSYEDHLRNITVVMDQGWKGQAKLIGTSHERAALHECCIVTGDRSAPSELAFLVVDEIGEDGRFIRSTMFDEDDRDSAYSELRRHNRVIAVYPEGVSLFLDGIAKRDAAMSRRGLHDDLVVNDRRRTGAGKLDGAEAYTRSLEALYELTESSVLHTLYEARWGNDCVASVVRVTGTNKEGGDFEIYNAVVMRWRDDRISNLDIYESADLDKALALLEENT